MLLTLLGAYRMASDYGIVGSLQVMRFGQLLLLLLARVGNVPSSTSVGRMKPSWLLRAIKSKRKRPTGRAVGPRFKIYRWRGW